jgi:hypothetical protein
VSDSEEPPVPPVDLGARYRGVVTHVGQYNAFLKLPEANDFEVMMPASEFGVEQGADLRERVLAEEAFDCVVKQHPRKKGDKVCYLLAYGVVWEPSLRGFEACGLAEHMQKKRSFCRLLYCWWCCKC